MISMFGAVTGIVLGLILCLIQQKFGLISLGGDGNFVVDAYPVSVHWGDVLLIFLTVLIVGFLSVWYPVRYLVRDCWINNHLKNYLSNHISGFSFAVSFRN